MEVQKSRRLFGDHFDFLRQLREEFEATGAVAPSSRFLARAIAKPFEQREGPARVLEVGPGTGAVTRRIVQLLKADDRLDLVELNGKFVEILERKFRDDPLFQAAADRRHMGNSGQPGYDVLQSHLASFGENAVEPLKARLRAATDECDRIVLGALIAELSGAEGKAMRVAALRETLWFDETAAGLLQLHELTGEDVFERLHGLMLGKRGLSSNKEKWKNAILAFGTLKEPRAVPILAELLK